jgi:uncharacterized protein
MFMKIWRSITEDILKKLTESDKIIILYGPRQVGKTTLCKDIRSQSDLKTLYINADEAQYNEVLSSRNAQKLGSVKIIVSHTCG